MNVSARSYGGCYYVSIDNKRVAIMERSPLTGEFCYGLTTGWLGEYGQQTYRPPFTCTNRKSIRAAIKVVAAAVQQS